LFETWKSVRKENINYQMPAPVNQTDVTIVSFNKSGQKINQSVKVAQL
jgi:hypothetical protein